MICACMFREATVIVSQAIVVFRAACVHGSDTLCKTALIHPFAILLLQLLRMTSVTFDPQAGTRDGELPPWEVAKAVAFHEVLSDVAQLLDTPAAELVGMRIDEYIANKSSSREGGIHRDVQ